MKLSKLRRQRASDAANSDAANSDAANSGDDSSGHAFGDGNLSQRQLFDEGVVAQPANDNSSASKL